MQLKREELGIDGCHIGNTNKPRAIIKMIFQYIYNYKIGYRWDPSLLWILKPRIPHIKGKQTELKFVFNLKPQIIGWSGNLVNWQSSRLQSAFYNVESTCPIILILF